METIGLIIVIALILFALGLYAYSGSSEPLSYNGSNKGISYESISRKELN